MKRRSEKIPDGRVADGVKARGALRRRVWTFGVVATVVIGLTATISVRPLLSGRSDVHRLQRDDLVLRQVLDLRATLADFQVFFEPHIAKFRTTPGAIDPTDIAKGDSSRSSRQTRR